MEDVLDEKQQPPNAVMEVDENHPVTDRKSLGSSEFCKAVGTIRSPLLQHTRSIFPRACVKQKLRIEE